MTFEGGTEDIISHILAEACDRPRDEHPSVVLHDVVGRPRRQAHVIVFANEKGSVGKSTLAFHCAVALAHLETQVLVLDCDGRQQTLHRLFEARDATARTLKVSIPRPRHAVVDRQSGASLAQEIERMGGDCDFVVIDLAGHDSPIARRAIALADTLVTPVNCSPTDLDAIGWINPVSRRFRRAGPFASVVTALRDERLVRGLGTFDWIVAKNRVRHCEHRLIAAVDQDLAAMARVLGFRTIGGLTERVSYRELLPFGVTQLDMGHLPALGAPRSHTLNELRRMVDGLRLPRPRAQAGKGRARKADSAPVLAPAARSYHEARRATKQPAPA